MFSKDEVATIIPHFTGPRPIKYNDILDDTPAASYDIPG